jgi:transglutaminase-like putative cysteine protease
MEQFSRQYRLLATSIAVVALLLGPTTWVLALWASNSLSSPASQRTVDLTYNFAVRDLPVNASHIAAYVPLPPENAQQRVWEYAVRTTYPYQVLVEAEYGNRFLRFDLSSAPRGAGSESVLTINYRIGRQVYRSGSEMEEPSRLARFLAPDRLVPIDGKLAEEARRVVGDETAAFERARLLYENIVRSVRYDKSGEGWGRGDAVFACDVRRGNCTDFHSLFIGEARALGIPARFVMGLPLPQNTKAGVIPGYHCWAEFHVPGLGWVPLDASEASKHPAEREAYFGALDANRIEFSVGRDIRLPQSQLKPLNYSIYPQVEVDGAVHARVSTEFSFRDRTPSQRAN